MHPFPSPQGVIPDSLLLVGSASARSRDEPLANWTASRAQRSAFPARESKPLLFRNGPSRSSLQATGDQPQGKRGREQESLGPGLPNASAMFDFPFDRRTPAIGNRVCSFG